MLTSSYRVFNLHLYEGNMVKIYYFCRHFKEKGIYTLDETAQNYTIYYQSRIAIVR